MDNNVYTNVVELTFQYVFGNETKVYLLNANSNTILRGGIIGKFSLGENTFIEASI